MEIDDMEGMRTVCNALFDTFVEYLNSEIIINCSPYFNQHQQDFCEGNSSRNDLTKSLLTWILEEDDPEAICQFTKALRDLTSDSNKTHQILTTDKSNQQQAVGFLVGLLDGNLIKMLSESDIKAVLDILLEQKIISKKLHQQAAEISDVHKCCMKVFKGITRGKTNWPFIFFDAVGKVRPDLSHSNSSNIDHSESHHMDQSDTAQVDQSDTAQVDQSEKDSVVQTSHNPDDSKTGIQIAGNVETVSNAETEDPLKCLEELSDLSKDTAFERLENKIYLTREQSNSAYVQAWLNSGNIDPGYFVFYDGHEEASQIYQGLYYYQDTAEETPKLQLREYQKELAEVALNGNNTIIIAPTGSGKTMVAAFIILNHLQQSQNGNQIRKVAFFARTVPLVMQQFQVLQKFLPKNFKVTYLTGFNKDSLHLELILPDYDVIVMTPRILENHLIRNNQVHVNIFSLMVFDECHHTRKEEPYNILMHFYLRRKFQKIGVTSSQQEEINLPQVVGLTATIGVDNASNLVQAVDNILQICGNLDVSLISCVEKHIEELNEKVQISGEELVVIHEREADEAVNKILEKMVEMEGWMKKLIKPLKNKELDLVMQQIPVNRKCNQYGHWAVKVQKLAKSLPRTRYVQINACKRFLIILADYLSTYNVALELHDLVLLRHVMEYLKICFDKYQKNKNCSTDEFSYFQSFSELQDKINDKLDEENPNLTVLKKCLLKYLIAKGEESRGIIFVRTRALARAITSWLNNCGDPRIQDLKATPFTGTAATAALGGMTVAQQAEVITLFKTGQVRLLVATSVAEEGIDIPECNLVIKYNYIGNEITTIQTRGRSRKKGGMSVILAMSKIIEKEKENQKKAEMMEKAIKAVKQMDPLEIERKNEQHQQQIMRDEEVNKAVKREMKNKLRRQHFKMVCHGCGNLVIDSDDIRTIYQTHRVVINSNILKKTKTHFEDRIVAFDDIHLIGPVKCRGRLPGGNYCNNKVGSMMIFSSVPFVVLGITKFGFEVADNEPLKTFKNWKFVPFIIDEIGPQDFERYLPAAFSQMTQNNDIISGVNFIQENPAANIGQLLPVPGKLQYIAKFQKVEITKQQNKAEMPGGDQSPDLLKNSISTRLNDKLCPSASVTDGNRADLSADSAEPSSKNILAEKNKHSDERVYFKNLEEIFDETKLELPQLLTSIGGMSSFETKLSSFRPPSTFSDELPSPEISEESSMDSQPSCSTGASDDNLVPGETNLNDKDRF